MKDDPITLESPSSVKGYYDYTSDWAIESFDFTSLQDDDDDNNNDNNGQDAVGRKHKNMLLSNNDCISHADTISTAGESASWGSSCEYQYLHNSSEAQSSATAVDASDDMDDSEHSLTMDDLKAFFVEDQVGIFDPNREDIPPPKARTDFKGDSQNSFTLDDLTDGFADDDDDDDENDTLDNPNNNNNNSKEGSLGCLLSSPTAKRKSQRKSKRRSSLLTCHEKEQHAPLKGILKNSGTYRSNTTTARRRSTSLTLLLMEDSNMLRLSLSSGGSSNLEQDVWSRFQQSFSADQALDLVVGKNVQFSTVVVHEHALIVGDNPSVREGVPLSIEWKAQASQTFETVDAYDSARETLPRGGKARRLDAEERMFRLLNCGISLQDLHEAEARTNQARGEREATKQQHLLLEGGLHTKTTKLFWKALQRCEDSDEDDHDTVAAPHPPPLPARMRKLSPPPLSSSSSISLLSPPNETTIHDSYIHPNYNNYNNNNNKNRKPNLRAKADDVDEGADGLFLRSTF